MVVRGLSVLGFIIEHGDHRIQDPQHIINGNTYLRGRAVRFDAQYSSICMLRGYGGRTIIDDTESLFYVVSYVVAYAYGDESIQGLFWLEHVPGFAKLCASHLNSLEIFSRILVWDSRPDDEGTVKVLEDLYSVPFDCVNPLTLCDAKDHDPRAGSYGEMMREMGENAV
ncbi:hypothetical protein EV182_000435 [Spiromyces aspiralis]|uniref:Uncharacterized protein n=1 Tax=Spiromyces aspiralis TaxID=68401 RepID=A0ACC1HGX1_9FUNG|nr:hypothetical protein EV182_000435 [Spiromyces aspiralis]